MRHLPLLFLIFLVACQPKNEHTNDTPSDDFMQEDLGELSMKVSGLEEAQKEFHKGLLLLHSFEYEDAREQFQLAQEKDTSMLMAYWGEAMTYNQPLWNRQSTEDGREVLERVGKSEVERLARAITEYEEDLWQGIEITFGYEGDKPVRDEVYRDYMKMLYEKYPDDHEIAAFYALANLGAVSRNDGRDEEAYGLSASVVKGIIEKNPQHPGALHYLIHAYDDPDHASMALSAADSYSKVAPDAEHALHMPSHIYVALGMWDEVVNSNNRAYQASINRMQKKGLDDNARGYHSMHWLQYGHLQRGEFEKARELLEQIKDHTEEGANDRANLHRTLMKAAYLVDSGNWNDELAELDTRCEEMSIHTQSINYFLDGMKAYAKKDIKTLRSVLDEMIEKRKDAEKSIYIKGGAMCGSWSSKLPTQVGVDQSKVMAMELESLYASLNGDDKAARDWLEKATSLEDEISFTYGPPKIVKPSHELFAEWLIEQGEYDAAEIEFEKALNRAPKRRLSQEGMNKIKEMGT